VVTVGRSAGGRLWCGFGDAGGSALVVVWGAVVLVPGVRACGAGFLGAFVAGQVG
jgi:hypothetical protein